MGLRQVTPSDDAHRAQIAALSGLLAGIAIGFAAGVAAALIFTRNHEGQDGKAALHSPRRPANSFGAHHRQGRQCLSLRLPDPGNASAACQHHKGLRVSTHH